MAYSGLEHFIDVPIKNYSSGMHMRLGFAIAANLNPDILLLDEIFAVGDADFQQRCIATVQRFLEEGKTIIFVSHATSAVRAICRRVCVLERGSCSDGDVDAGLEVYEGVVTRLSHAWSDASPEGGSHEDTAKPREAELSAPFGGRRRPTRRLQIGRQAGFDCPSTESVPWVDTGTSPLEPPH